MIKKCDKNAERLKRHARVRNHLSGTAERPRLCIYRSLNSIYAQIIDDTKGATLVSCNSLEKELEKQISKKSKTEQAKVVGATVAKRAMEKGITEVVFDRGGYLNTGRVAALADAAREQGLKF